MSDQTPPTLSAFAAAVEAARTDLARVNGRIDELEAEKRRVLSLPPHTDDIIAVLLRGVEQASGEFTRQLGARLAESFGTSGSAERAGRSAALNLLRLEAQAPDREALMTRAMKGQAAPDLNIAALTYFLRDKIEEAIPELVDWLFPQGREGMSALKRQIAVAQLDEGIATLIGDRERLQAELGDARAAFGR